MDAAGTIGPVDTIGLAAAGATAVSAAFEDAGLDVVTGDELEADGSEACESEAHGPEVHGTESSGSEGIGTEADAAATARRLVAERGAELDLLVTVGTTALLGAASASPAIPLLAVDGPRGALPVDRDALPAVVDGIVAGEAQTRTRPLLTASGDGIDATALLEVTLFAAPTDISEFSIASVDEAGARLPVDRVRADGVVVATPAGSVEYACDAGGPVVGPGVRAASVVPVAPFTIDRERWVLELPLTVTVERDDADVVLAADGRRIGAVDPGTPIAVDVGSSVALVAPSASRRECGRADRLEKT